MLKIVYIFIAVLHWLLVMLYITLCMISGFRH